MSAETCEERATLPDSPKRARPPGCAGFSPLRRCSSVIPPPRDGYARSSRLGETKNRQQRGMDGYFNRLLAKTNQIFQLPSEIAVNTDIASEHKVIVDLEPYSGLLLTSSRINRSQIQIEPIENRIALGRLAFFDDFPVKLLYQ